MRVARVPGLPPTENQTIAAASSPAASTLYPGRPRHHLPARLPAVRRRPDPPARHRALLPLRSHALRGVRGPRRRGLTSGRPRCSRDATNERPVRVSARRHLSGRGAADSGNCWAAAPASVRLQLFRPAACRVGVPSNNQEKRTRLPRPHVGRRQLETRVSQSCFKREPQPCAARRLYQQRQHWTAPRKGRRPCAVLLRPVAGALLSGAGFGAPFLLGHSLSVATGGRSHERCSSCRPSCPRHPPSEPRPYPSPAPIPGYARS
jgi:hypothetical protein